MGLPETFDMAKRIGLLVLVGRLVGRGEGRRTISEQQLLMQYADVHPQLKLALMNYHKGCFQSLSGYSPRSGLPDAKSATSFSKVARVAAGMELIEMMGSQKTRQYRANAITMALVAISDSLKVPLATFDLPTPVKGLVTDELLRLDGDLILALYLAVQQAGREGVKKSQQLYRDFGLGGIDLLRWELEAGLFKPSSPMKVIKRVKFLEENLQLLARNLHVKRGFLHMVEPRIHWLIDLDLIDVRFFCTEGLLRVPQDHKLARPESIAEFNSCISRLQAFAVSWRWNREGMPYLTSIPEKDVTEEDIRKSLVRAARILQSHYPGFIPVESVTRVSRAILLQDGFSVPEDRLLGLIASAIQAPYRGLTSGGFVDPKVFGIDYSKDTSD